MKSSSALVSRRYAHALLDAVGDLKLDAEEIRGTLRTAAHVLAAERDLLRVLEAPQVPPAAKSALISTLCGGAGDTHLVVRLIAVLAQRGRLSLLADVEQAYARLWHLRSGVLSAEAISATPLSRVQIETLQHAVEKASGKRVEITPRVDTRVVGGVMLRIGDRIFDGSIRARLKALRATLEQAVSAY
jgi:F-type H+-transporting ATPase subunit delta